MEARQIKRLMSRPPSERDRLIAEGLGHLLEHVTRLTGELNELQERGGARSAAVIGLVAEEEAAKILILLDLVRMGWGDQEACVRQLRKFTDHLARGIYADVTSTKPGTYRDVVTWVERERRSHYLDGPNDVDWSFRNDIETRREEALYVDFISTDDGDRWVTPARRDEFPERWPTAVIHLVLGLGKLSVLTSTGMEVLRRHWDGVVIEQDTHWTEVQKLNFEVLSEVASQPRIDGLTPREAEAVREYWTFPMHSLDMKKIDVTRAERKQQQDDWLASQW